MMGCWLPGSVMVCPRIRTGNGSIFVSIRSILCTRGSASWSARTPPLVFLSYLYQYVLELILCNLFTKPIRLPLQLQMQWFQYIIFLLELVLPRIRTSSVSRTANWTVLPWSFPIRYFLHLLFHDYHLAFVLLDHCLQMFDLELIRLFACPLCHPICSHFLYFGHHFFVDQLILILLPACINQFVLHSY